MSRTELTSKQKLAVAKAKQNGKRRAVVKLTVAQRRSEELELSRIEKEVRSELGHAEPSELAIQLRIARKAAGMSLADAGQAAKMTRQAVLAIECGSNSNPKIDTLRRLARSVGMELQIDLVSISD